MSDSGKDRPMKIRPNFSQVPIKTRQFALFMQGESDYESVLQAHMYVCDFRSGLH